MKSVCLAIVLVFTVFAARADLTLEEAVIHPAPPATNSAIIRIKGSKIRVDDSGSSVILNVTADEGWQLVHEKKEARKISFLKLKQTVEYTNAAARNANLAKPRGTGKTETINGHATEVYSWTNSRGCPVRLWVAKDFPHFKAIKRDLAQLDRFNNETTEKLAADLSSLPGMVVKWEQDGVGEERGKTDTMVLFSAKEDTIPASIFDVPEGYRDVTER